MADVTLSEGQVIAGKYRVERVIGQGGMAVVLAAHHLQLDERVAIKLLLPSMLESPDAVARFLREARAAIKIKSEHVARVMDVATTDTGEPMMVMEYLEGEDLSVMLERRKTLPAAEAVDIVLEACEAVAEAHALGIVHRDLKPANLFLARRPGGVHCVKVLDFGISKVTPPGAGKAASMTSTQAVMGSPLYMSPEQMSSSRNVDARADLWSIGTILYEAISGEPPFQGESITHLVAAILTENPRPLCQLVPRVSEELQTVIFRCLEKDRDRRWWSVAELAAALAPHGSPRAFASAEKIAQVCADQPPATVAAGPATVRATQPATVRSDPTLPMRQSGSTEILAAPPASAIRPPATLVEQAHDAGPSQTTVAWGQTGSSGPGAPKAKGWAIVVAALVVGLVAAAGGIGWVFSRDDGTVAAPAESAALVTHQVPVATSALSTGSLQPDLVEPPPTVPAASSAKPAVTTPAPRSVRTKATVAVPPPTPPSTVPKPPAKKDDGLDQFSDTK